MSAQSILSRASNRRQPHLRLIAFSCPFSSSHCSSTLSGEVLIRPLSKDSKPANASSMRVLILALSSEAAASVNVTTRSSFIE